MLSSLRLRTEEAFCLRNGTQSLPPSNEPQPLLLWSRGPGKDRLPEDSTCFPLSGMAQAKPLPHNTYGPSAISRGNSLRANESIMKRLDCSVDHSHCQRQILILSETTTITLGLARAPMRLNCPLNSLHVSVGGSSRRNRVEHGWEDREQQECAKH